MPTRKRTKPVPTDCVVTGSLRAPRPARYTESEVRDLIEKSKKPLNLLDEFDQLTRDLASYDVQLAEARNRVTSLEGHVAIAVKKRLDIAQKIGHAVSVNLNK